MSEPKEPKQGLNLTADDLQALISAAVTAAVAESKKPAPPSQSEKAAIEQAQQLRAEQATLVIAKRENERVNRQVCSHRHGSGESHCVHIIDGNYILCQSCQGKIRPGVAPVGYSGSDQYDTALFNRLFQETTLADM